MPNKNNVKTKSGLKKSLAKKIKYLRPAIGIAILVAVVGLALAHGDSKPKIVAKTPQTACGPYRDDEDVKLGPQNIKVEVTRDNVERAKGLGGRPCILPDQGMLFPFPKPGTIPIWMKDMKFPIDIIWINSEHKIVAMEINEDPKTYPDRFENKALAQYVLEIKANESKQLGVTIGSLVNF